MSGESALAQAVIEQALGRGLSRAEIYLDVLAPSQVRLGEMWHEGRINVAQEHLATSITMAVMDHLRQGMTPRAGLGVRAVVTPVEGDHHSIGARMIADFLAVDGWEVYFLGDGTPAKDLSEFVRQRNADLVAISSHAAGVPAERQIGRRRDPRTHSPAPKDSCWGELRFPEGPTTRRR